MNNNSQPQINETAAKYIKHIKEICKEKNPLVVIRCIAYNHAMYLRDALDGFIMQKTNFSFVAIVHDDASTDGTDNIIREYSEKYPDIILPIFEKENQYSKKDGSLTKILDEACDAVNAKYIAICEGDDYWIDPSKLQKQVNFLDSNPDYGFCYTKANILKEDKIIGIWGSENTTFESHLSLSNFPTLTRMYRTVIYHKYLKEVNPSIRRWLMGDYPFALYCILKTKIKFIDEISSVYRYLENSASHSNRMEYLMKFYDSADDIRFFFINNFIDNVTDKEKLKKIIKYNEVNYKIKLLIKNRKFGKASEILRKEKKHVSKRNKMFCFIGKYMPLIMNIVLNIKQTI